jgi:hypothetical protein
MKVVLLAARRSGRTSARWPVDGAEDAALLVLAWRHHLHSLALDDPGRAHPGQQVGVGLVLARDHRPLGQGRDRLVEGCQLGCLLGVTLGHQSGSAPVGPFPHPPGEGGQGHRRETQPSPQTAHRPGSRRRSARARGAGRRSRVRRRRAWRKYEQDAKMVLASLDVVEDAHEAIFCAADAPLARPRIRSRTGSATIRYAFFVGLMRDGRIGGSRFVARRAATGCNPARGGRVPGA